MSETLDVEPTANGSTDAAAAGESLKADSAPKADVAAETHVVTAPQSQPENSPVTERLNDLARGIAEANRVSEGRERIIDRLHAEVQALRTGELQQAVAPLLRDLLRLGDQLDRTALNYAGRTEVAPAEIKATFEGFRDDVSDVLLRYGLERFDATEGSRFDPKEHRAIEAVTTADAGQDGCIARIIRSGFKDGAKIVRHPQVAVFRFAAPADGAAIQTQSND